jgi:Oxaloacetate decarboxylase, gamma chain.
MVEYSNLFVVLMGMGVVFFGLICIILLTMIMGTVLRPKKSKESAGNQTGISGMDLQEGPQAGIRPEILAIITSVLSEEVGTTPYGLNIVNIERL